jgi:hypothetical protein
VGSWDLKNGTQNEVLGSEIWPVQDDIPCGKNIHIRLLSSQVSSKSCFPQVVFDHVTAVSRNHLSQGWLNLDPNENHILAKKNFCEL